MNLSNKFDMYFLTLVYLKIRYSDIAKYSFEVIKEREKSKAQPSDNSKNNDTERPGVDG